MTLTEHHRKSGAPAVRKGFSFWKVLIYTVLSFATMILVAAVVLVVFTDSIVNTYFNGTITQSLEKAFPAYVFRIGTVHCGIWENRIECASIHVEAKDSTMRCAVTGLSIGGVGWLHLLLGNGSVSSALGRATIKSDTIVVMFPVSQYELRVERLNVSVPDSQIAVEGFTLHPSGDDEDFFAISDFRRTRFRINVPRIRLMGLACLDLLQGQRYSASAVQIRDVFLDVLINKEKPSAKDTLSPPMPNEILLSLNTFLKIDSVMIENGNLRYGERFALGAKAAIITFDGMRVVARGITNQRAPGNMLVIESNGIFMNTGAMNLRMAIPLASPEFSLQCDGSTGRMDLRSINSFIEISDHMRITAGVLQESTFKINVASGHAGGAVRAVYNGLTLAALSKRTGSANGLSDRLVSFIANTFKIRQTNKPDKSGSLTIGKVNYQRKHDDPFFGFTWFALRSGLKDLVGF